ncbi:hypothetical protein TCON_1922 [Astathelohania contejeani]|uniref:Shelterin complex subunit TPP1/Est3 domain-containing protein n=1 Tax=Astathelohania contejeani TaxID=164912 RepID=A0ABQ7HXG2_9MICR|nr:hypothetical protein TCON_1922 [Thelohania contejeani]
MSSFLREPWIYTFCREQYTQGTLNHQLPLSQSSICTRAQLIEIIREYPNHTLETYLSDKHHFIRARILPAATAQFREEYDLPFYEIKGCFLVLDRFFYDLCWNKKEFILVVEGFTYSGSESPTIGDPLNINQIFPFREMKHHSVFKEFEEDELEEIIEWEVGVGPTKNIINDKSSHADNKSHATTHGIYMNSITTNDSFNMKEIYLKKIDDKNNTEFHEVDKSVVDTNSMLSQMTEISTDIELPYSLPSNYELSSPPELDNNLPPTRIFIDDDLYIESDAVDHTDNLLDLSKFPRVKYNYKIEFANKNLEYNKRIRQLLCVKIKNNKNKKRIKEKQIKKNQLRIDIKDNIKTSNQIGLLEKSSINNNKQTNDEKIYENLEIKEIYRIVNQEETSNSHNKQDVIIDKSSDTSQGIYTTREILNDRNIAINDEGIDYKYKMDTNDKNKEDDITPKENIDVAITLESMISLEDIIKESQEDKLEDFFKIEF